MPERIQLQRKKGWRKPEGSVVVARPTKWGNPFKPDPAIPKDSRLTVCVSRYQQWLISGKPHVEDTDRDGQVVVRNPLLDLHELRGKDLCCWCPLPESDADDSINRLFPQCHADVLLSLANDPWPDDHPPGFELRGALEPFGRPSGLVDSKLGDPVSIRPCGEQYGDRTYLGFYLGQLPIRYHSSRSADGVSVGCTTNPAIYVPALHRIVWGYESWWGAIASPEDLREITDKTISELWYVRALKALGEDDARQPDDPVSP